MTLYQLVIHFEGRLEDALDVLALDVLAPTKLDAES